MHDLKFANEIIHALRKKLSGTKASKISVNVRLSPLTHVTPKGLKETFGIIAEAEGFAGVRLEIKPLEFEMKCRSCKTTSKHHAPVFECPACKSSDFDIITGKEFDVESIEVEK